MRPLTPLLCSAAILAGCAWDAPRELRQRPLWTDAGLPPLDVGPPPPAPDDGPPPAECDVPVLTLRGDAERLVGEGRVAGGAATLPTGCGSDGRAAVFAFTPREGGVWRFSSEGSRVQDTVVTVYEGCRADSALLACNDDTDRGTQAVAEAQVQAGQPVYVAVSGYAGSSEGDVRLEVTRSGAPQEGEPCDPDDPGACGRALACWWAQDRNVAVCQAPRERGVDEICAPDGRLGPCVDEARCVGDGPGARCAIAGGGGCPPGVAAGELEQFRVDETRWLVPSADVQSGGVLDQCLSSEPRRHRIWRLFITDGGRYSFQTRQPQRDRGVDTVLEVSLRCDAGRPLACDDDGGSGTFSRADVELSAGMEVFVKVSAFGPGETGAFQLAVSRR